jgi:diguanylate cyclase (GGDEF)-like protein/PAS domain S-box-containing protein
VTTDVSIECILQPDILTCSADTPLATAARRMVEARCSSILVLDDQGAVLGIWTEHDALTLDMADARIFQAPIARHMSSPVKTLPSSTSLGEAAQRFREERVRHFLVVDGTGARKGIVTQTDIVVNQGIEYYLSLRELSSVLNRRHAMIASTVPVREAVARMHADGSDAILVAYEDGSHGILTERDVMRLISATIASATVGEVASRPLICVGSDVSLYHARHLFTDRHIRHLGVTDAQGQLLGLVAFADILSSIEHEYAHRLRETLKEREHSLAISLQHQRLAAKVFESTLEGILVTNAQRMIESVNPAFTRITGYTAAEVIGKTPALLSSGRHDAAFYRRMHNDLQAHGHWQGEIWNRRRNGEVYPEWLTINTVRNEQGEIVNYVGVFSDITRRKAEQEQMQFLAYHDGLTGLPNRGLFLDRLHHAVAHAHRSRTLVAVLFIDLDNFKLVNDTLGHHVGDRLLQTVAERLTAAVREADTVARLGGDEFTVILESLGDAGDAPLIVQKIVEAVSRPMQIDGQAVTTTASVGVSLYPVDSASADDLLRHADTAMYRAKNGGRNSFCFFDPESPVSAPAGTTA